MKMQIGSTDREKWKECRTVCEDPYVAAVLTSPCCSRVDSVPGKRSSDRILFNQDASVLKKRTPSWFRPPHAGTFFKVMIANLHSHLCLELREPENCRLSASSTET